MTKTSKPSTLGIFFAEYFGVSPHELSKYGAFNISLVTDLPLFIDPFLLFNSKNKKYQALHSEIINYVIFLRDKSLLNGIKPGLIKSWFYFSEVKQNWFGYSKLGNRGSGLGKDFAEALNRNLNKVFSNFGNEAISMGSHLEKLCLVKDGVGRDLISDFCTNLIKSYLLEYTQNFAKKYIKSELIKKFTVEKVRFNYITETWEQGTFELPVYMDDYVILTPVDLLTKDDAWINKNDLIGNFDQIADTISNEQIRAEINNYFLKILPTKPTAKDKTEAIINVINKFPDFIDYYIKFKEDNGEEAVALSSQKIHHSQKVYIENVNVLRSLLETHYIGFFEQNDSVDSYQEAFKRVMYLKDVIENKDGYRIFYIDGNPVKREADLQIMFRLACYGSSFDVNREVNNGRGSVDYKISKGYHDSALIEFKLASNTKLRKNLEKQIEIYEIANNTKNSLKVILYFNDSELERVNAILHDLGVKNNQNIILIDASDNKLSASNA